MDMAKFRSMYPQYSSLSDGELSYRIWDKYYKGKKPMGEFADSIELDNPGFNEMIRRARESGYEPTAVTQSEGYEPPKKGLRNFLQGQTLGFSDELIGGISALAQKAGGSARPIGELAREGAAYERNQLEQSRAASPVGSMAQETAGALATPAIGMEGLGVLRSLGPMWRALATGTAEGAVYGAGSTEGELAERGEGAVEVGLTSGLFGAGAQQLFRLAGKGAQRLKDAIDKVPERPTIEALRNVKNAAYDAVDASGVKFSRKAMNRLYQNALQVADDVNYVPEVDRQTFAALKMMEAQLGKNLTIGELDKLRQGLYKRLGASNGSEIAIEGMIDGIDQMIESVPASNQLMLAARAANSRYKKAELLENAFTKADLQTAATGSGGNVLNKYRQAVASILNNPKQAKWFSQAEKDQMQNFVSGTLTNNALRQIGKLSPSGNGLMTALNVGAIAANPALAGVTAGAVGAKAVSDFSTKRGAEKLMDVISTGRIPTQIPYLPGLGAGVASVVAQENE